MVTIEKAMEFAMKTRRQAFEGYILQHNKVQHLPKVIDKLKNLRQSSTANDEEIFEVSFALPQDGINLIQKNHGHADGRPISPCIGDEVSRPISEIKMKLPTEQDEATIRE